MEDARFDTFFTWRRMNVQAFQQEQGRQLHISTLSFTVVYNSLVLSSKKTREVLLFFLKPVHFQICFAELKIFIVTV